MIHVTLGAFAWAGSGQTGIRYQGGSWSETVSMSTVDASVVPLDCAGGDRGRQDLVAGALGAQPSDTVTTMPCRPVAPSGRGGCRSAVWVRPVPSVARTRRSWLPGVASHS